MGGPKSWTFAILSDLKEKVRYISRPKLSWVLSTALPLRDDFTIHLDGTKLVSSKAGKGLLKKWVVGKDIVKLPKPAPKDIEAVEDKKQNDSASRTSIFSASVPAVTKVGFLLM